MSQAKVDKRKYEKKNRKQLEKKRKARFAAKCIVAALIIGAIVGVPVGVNIYRSIPKFIGDSTLSAFVGEYIDDNHSSEVDTVKAIEAASAAKKEEESQGGKCADRNKFTRKDKGGVIDSVDKIEDKFCDD